MGPSRTSCPLSQVQAPGPEPLEVPLRVRDEEEGPPLRQQALHPGVALLPEGLVTDREHLVDEEDRFVERGDDRETEPHLHPGGQVAVRPVERRANLRAGEVDDVLEALLDLGLGQPVQAGLHPEVVAAGQLAAETSRELDEGGDPPIDLDGAAVGQEHPGDRLEQGALAAAVTPDQAHRLAPGDLEGDVLQRPEGVRGRRRTTVEQQVAHLHLAAARGVELDPDVLRRDDHAHSLRSPSARSARAARTSRTRRR